jgi:ribosomal protein S15P/S13E
VLYQAKLIIIAEKAHAVLSAFGMPHNLSAPPSIMQQLKKATTNKLHLQAKPKDVHNNRMLSLFVCGK